jgi:exosortase/archaeosortase family protein
MRSLFVNKTARIFIVKLIAIILVWECSCHFVLKPARVPDKLLTDIIACGTAKGINLFCNQLPVTWTEKSVQPGSNILQNGKIVFFISDGCNGLDLIAIYILLIVLLPYSLTRKIVFGIGGIIAIILVNILRCISLFWIYFRCRDTYEFNHHYVFTILMYLVIFSGWLLFTKTDIKHEVN